MIGYNSTSLRHTLPPCTLQSSNSCSLIPFDHAKQQRIVIIGAGPTGLGAAHRLYNMGILNSNTQVVVLERESQPGGLASSIRDRNGFLWDNGGHVVFSHYKYFDNALDNAVRDWNQLKRAAFAFMMGSDGTRRFIPYPVQANIHAMCKEDRQVCLNDSTNGTVARDSEWGPNRLFRFPRYGGTGGIWKAVARKLPQGWFHYKQNVIKINVIDKTLVVIPNDDPSQKYTLEYDHLVSTVPLDSLLQANKDVWHTEKCDTECLVHSHTHIMGVGLRGKPPVSLENKSWMYFPDSDSPFYRATVFSSYSKDHVPTSGEYWSLMCEAAKPSSSEFPERWTEEYLLNTTVAALVNYGFIAEKQVVSRYHHRLEHGYPVPTLRREEVLRSAQPWLESRGVYSRGRFGGWRYEVGNQDHSFMQGVEVSDFIMTRIPSETYSDPGKVNSMASLNQVCTAHSNL